MVPRYATARELREAIRRREFDGQTSGQAPGFAQTNVVILPVEYADEFEEFCRLNDRPCPLVERSAVGEPRFARAAPSADLRTDVSRYRVFRNGVADTKEPSDIVDLWRDDFVGFLLGCSFTFERALVDAGLPVRHIEQGRNVPMYVTRRACRAAGRFQGPLVVSMRPFTRELARRAADITARYPKMHGGPVHIGDPGALGIADLARPDFGDAVRIDDDETPVFWACGVTPQMAMLAAKPSIAICHSPGCMFVTDLRDADYEEAAAGEAAPAKANA